MMEQPEMMQGQEIPPEMMAQNDMGMGDIASANLPFVDNEQQLE
jgi:hypothetical protein